MTDFIYEDQVGFLPNRQLRENVRFIIDAVEYYDKNSDHEVSFFFVDAEKAFDNINWVFLFKAIQFLGLGENFLKAIQAIYQT